MEPSARHHLIHPQQIVHLISGGQHHRLHGPPSPPLCFPCGNRNSVVVVIVAFLIFMQGNCGLIIGQTAGLMRLHHAYTRMGTSSPWNASRFTSQQRFGLLKAHDEARRRRLLASVADFPLGGNSDPFIAGLYFTKITIGTPSKEYFVQVDTGSDILWLNCYPCKSCPIASSLQIPMIQYDPHTSSTSSSIPCKDPICESALKIADISCNFAENCGYRFEYGDGSTATGYIVEDIMAYNEVASNNALVNAEASIVFGCSESQSGDLLTSDRALDGIMGFGQSGLSVISQLSSQGKTPRIFAHCLRGDDTGGGILILGNVVEPGIVYTAIVPSQKHYNVNLKGISVNGVDLNVDLSVFETSDGKGTIFDSGTTLLYLIEPAYGAFINAIIEGAPQQAQTFYLQDTVCFRFMGSIEDTFPHVSFHFEGADMNMKANDYLIQQASVDDWCIGWQPTNISNNDIHFTILGDLVLKNKLVVYDLENQQIGWINYDCSSNVNVSTAVGVSHTVNPHRLGSDGSSKKKTPFNFNFLFSDTTDFKFLVLRDSFSL